MILYENGYRDSGNNERKICRRSNDNYVYDGNC